MFEMFNDGHLETTHSEINNGIQSQAAMKTKHSLEKHGQHKLQKLIRIMYHKALTTW